jgi:four helix bundle protein
MSYKNLEIWQMARELSIDIHKMTLTLPKLEMFEEGAQIRKSSKNVRSTIVEGYGRRYYKADYVKFIIYALASTDETRDHLETLFETGSLSDKTKFDDLHRRLDILGRKINNFLTSIQQSHSSAKEPEEEYLALSKEDEVEHPDSGIKHQASSI